MKVKDRFTRFASRRRRLLAIAVISVIVVIGSAAYLRFIYGWGWANWTGFNEYTDPKGEYQRAKTLWDWMDLLVVPIVLATGAWWLTKSDNRIEREIATDRQQQTTLEAYFDQMTSLLLNSDLRRSEKGAEVRSIARSRTLTVLRVLDPARRSLVLMFLKESNLINKDNVIVDLRQADLSGVTFEPGFQGAWDDSGWGFDLSNAYLRACLKNRSRS
jgi:hypothetical protein